MVLPKKTRMVPQILFGSGWMNTIATLSSPSYVLAMSPALETEVKFLRMKRVSC